VVDGSGDVPGLSPGVGEVNCYTPLNGRSLTGEFASQLHSPALGVDLPSAVSRLLLLLIGFLLVRKEPNVWL
jgi:hypothetical protein